MISKAFEKGLTKYKALDFEGAVVEFTLALEKDPGNPEILYQRAMSYFHLKNKNLALIDMDAALEMQPNNAYRYSSRAYMRDTFGDVIGAIKDYKSAIEFAPDDAISYNNLGILEDKMGRIDMSQAYYRKADKILETKHMSGTRIGFTLGSGINNQRLKMSSPKESVTSNSQSLKEVLKSILTRDGIREFLLFVKNGFKL